MIIRYNATMPRLLMDVIPDVKSLGFYVSRGRPNTMPKAHAHTDIEGNFIVAGKMTYLHGGRFYSLSRGRLAFFWAGIPHRLIEVDPGTQVIWLVLPLAWYMQWQLPDILTQKMFQGEMLSGDDSDIDSAMDELAFSRWVNDMSAGDKDVRRIVMLELEARLRRLSLRVAQGIMQQPSADDASASHTQKLAAYMAQHYRQGLNVPTISQAVGLHPNYATQLFKKSCGMGMWEYLTRLRISHAQRLLLTTNWKINRIALESGFASPSRFYEAFARVAGCRPGNYRSGKT